TRLPYTTLFRSVLDKTVLKESDVFVTLEPCAHYGNTPPCADLLVQHQVRSVIIGAVDTNPLVGGKGVDRLKKAGINVKTGVLEAESRQLNRRFFTFMEKQKIGRASCRERVVVAQMAASGNR